MRAEVLACCVGKAAPFARGENSAIDKRPVEGPVRITKLGIEGDEQADRRVHGGEEMAVHAYANDHYAWWLDQIGPHHRLPAPGSFGENLATSGLTESEICVGDRFRLGAALLEVSQARQPCWKLETHLRREGVVKAILESHRSGWYFRVIEEGDAEAPSQLELVERAHEGWTLERVFALLLDPRRKGEPGELRDMAALARLSPQWRERAQQLLNL